MLRPIIGEHVEISTSLVPGLGKVVADSGQMEQVVMNLILNARDAIPTGGSISIRTGSQELDRANADLHGMAPGACVTISISDTGHGIEPGKIEHIFEPFYTTKAKGTGIGLSTVRRIVKEAGGDVWARSAPGEGATFTVYLPATLYSPEAAEPQIQLRPARGSETILLVEDEDGVRRLLQHVLDRRGYRVLVAPGGDEALEIFRQRGSEIDIVLTDMVMPKMNGRELADRLNEIRPDLRIMFMSGYPGDVLMRTGALRPGMSVLQKPLRPDVLAAKLREALDSPALPFNPR
jgi:CheY-like chemotaxis protein